MNVLGGGHSYPHLTDEVPRSQRGSMLRVIQTQWQSWGLNPGSWASTVPLQPWGPQHEYFPCLILGLRQVWKGFSWSSNPPSPGEVEKLVQGHQSSAAAPSEGSSLRACCFPPTPSQDCGLQIALLMEGNQGFLEKWLIQDLGRESTR